MFSVIFEVHPKADRWDAYLDNAKMLRPELEKLDGFVDNTRYRSLTREGWILSLSGWRGKRKSQARKTACLVREIGMPRYLQAAAAAAFVLATGMMGAAQAQTSVIQAEGLAHTPYQSAIQLCGSSAVVCKAQFTKVPAGKRLVTVNVSCGFEVPHPVDQSGSIVGGVEFNQTGTSIVPTYWLPILYTKYIPNNDLDNYVFGGPIFAVFNAGETPQITISSQLGVGGGICTLTGYLAKL